MKTAQQLIKHELLNIFTVMGHILATEQDSRKAKKQLCKLMTLSSLLVSHSEIFSNKEPKFFYQKVLLNELLETAFYISQENEVVKNELKIFPEKVFLKLDRYYMGEALREILRRLFQASQPIDTHFDLSSLTLKFRHNGKKILPSKINLLHILNSKNRENHEIFFQLALKILELSKVQLQE